MTTEPCADCVRATLGPWHSFTPGCLVCAARSVSRGPNYRASRDSGQQTRRYRAELEHLGVTHAQVLEAVKADALTNTNRQGVTT